jgi:long-subunit fatty acid transport protein
LDSLVSRLSRLALLLVVLQMGASAARPQNDLQPAFEFTFSNPGARSMGLGGAFAALADDATAALANPAGLVQIAEPELSLEGRSWSYSTPYVAGGRIFGEPTGFGLDDTSGLRYGESSAELAALSFVSFVYPAKRWSLALSRHQVANFETSGALQGLYSGPWPNVTPIRREWDQRRRSDLEIVGHTVSAAYRVRDDLSLGLGLSHFEGELTSVTEVYGLAEPTPDSFFLPIPFVPENLLYSASVEIDDTDWGLVGGLLWRGTRHLRVAAFFREGPELDGVVLFTTGDGVSHVFQEQPMAFPDVYGLGLSYRTLGERLTLGLEWDRVGYSSLLGFFNAPGFENKLEDGDEIHLGVEYVLLETRPAIALRAGAWIDPAHRIHSDQGYVVRAVLPPADDELHASAGLGFAFGRFQLDIGLDFSDHVDTASISMIHSL